MLRPHPEPPLASFPLEPLESGPRRLPREHQIPLAPGRLEIAGHVDDRSREGAHFPLDPAELRSPLQPPLRSLLRLAIEPFPDLGLDPPPLHPRHRRPQVTGRLPPDPLDHKTPMIDPDPVLQKLLVGQLCPTLPDRLDLPPGWRELRLPAVGIGPLDRSLLAQPAGFDNPRRGEQMGMVIPLVPCPVRGVDRKIHRHPVPVGNLGREPPHQIQPLGLGQLAGQRDLVLQRHPGSAARYAEAAVADRPPPRLTGFTDR